MSARAETCWGSSYSARLIADVRAMMARGFDDGDIAEAMADAIIGSVESIGIPREARAVTALADAVRGLARNVAFMLREMDALDREVARLFDRPAPTVPTLEPTPALFLPRISPN